MAPPRPSTSQAIGTRSTPMPSHVTSAAAPHSVTGSGLFFIVGADSVPEMRTWRSLRRIFELARVVAVNRPGHAASFAPELFEDVPPALLERARADAVEMPPSAASSTEVRERVARGEDVGDLVPPAVAGYIAERGLYRSEPGADASGR